MAVTKLLITSRRPFAQEQTFGHIGPYEQLDGTVSFAVDPNHSANQLITDLKLAPRDVSGRVHFWADWRLLRPVEPQRGNHRLLFDILNRGRGPGLRNLNSAQDVAPTEPLDPGNGFLMRQGYTVAWCGWQHDVPEAPGLMRLRTPEALTPEGPISGKVMVTFQPTTSTCVQFLADRLHRPYPTSNLEDRDAVLTEQDHEDAPARIIPRAQWCFARLENDCVVPDAAHVYMASGFVPGKVYQVIYTTRGATIVGCRLLATRDLGSFLKYGTAGDGNPCAGDLEYAYSFGVSQSGRFLRHFLYLGLNQDEQDRTVFDGLIPHVAGGKHGEFNHRFAQPSSQASRSPNNLFPYSDVEQTDPETGRTGGLLSRLAAQGTIPKVMHTYTSSEYWGGHGALVHIDVTGSRDLEIPESLRRFGRLDFGPQAGIATHVPPVSGKPYPRLVPALDQDGNEVCGIRLPFQTVPLATHTGWNLRHPDIGGAGQTLATGGASGGTLSGATVPFPATREGRQATGDPRRSIAERYASKADYLEQISQAAQTLVQARSLLAEDVDEIVSQAAQHFDLVCGQR